MGAVRIQNCALSTALKNVVRILKHIISRIFILALYKNLLTLVQEQLLHDSFPRVEARIPLVERSVLAS